jgi:hypothetical protein
MHTAMFGIASVVGHLGIKPGMERGGQLAIARLVANTAAVGQIFVGECHFGGVGFQHSQTRHVLAVNGGRVAKVASSKLGGFVA